MPTRTTGHKIVACPSGHKTTRNVYAVPTSPWGTLARWHEAPPGATAERTQSLCGPSRRALVCSTCKAQCVRRDRLKPCAEVDHLAAFPVWCPKTLIYRSGRFSFFLLYGICRGATTTGYTPSATIISGLQNPVQKTYRTRAYALFVSCHGRSDRRGRKESFRSTDTDLRIKRGSGGLRAS